MPSLPTIIQLSQQLQAGATSSIQLVNECIERIEDPSGEGHRVFLELDTEAARTAAKASDLLRQSGSVLSPLMGIPVSVKDLFDVAGQVTRVGSIIRNDAEPAVTDAVCIDLLRRAGAIIIGRTNMTEFAYSGLGLNPHHGTPASPYDRNTRRIPGGSSAGAGVSVSDQMAVIGMGTDTGGSVRIPAALCGVTGFKPSTGRVSTKGAFPLSTTYDSVGPLAPSVSCCITVDQILTQQAPASLSPFPIKNCRLAIPSGIATDHLDQSVTASFEAALNKLARAGARIEEVRFDPIEDPMRPSNAGRILAAEAYAWHRKDLEEKSTRYDQRVSTRMMPAANTSAADYIDLLNWRRHFLHDIKIAMEPYDALILPTTPIIAPPIADLESNDDHYFSTNVLMLRNTSIINQIDGCALSIPCHEPNTPPVGFMIAGSSIQDEKILRIGLTIEKVLGFQS